MFCKNCGNRLEPKAQFCRSCGAKVAQDVEPEPMHEPVPAPDNKTVEPVRTVYVQPTYVQAPSVPEQPKSNDMAIVGFVMAFIVPLVGLILSIIGLNNAKKGGQHRGLATAGVAISAVYMASSLLYVFSVLFVLFGLYGGFAGMNSVVTLAVGSMLIL